MSEFLVPAIPDQLQPLFDDHARAVHERWAHYSYDDVRTMMPDLTTIDLDDDRRRRVAVLDPVGEIDEGLTLAMLLPYQQGWKPSMFIRAAVTRDMVAPNSRMVVLPNNAFNTRYNNNFELFADEEMAMRQGKMRPYYVMETRTLESEPLRMRGRIGLTGYSQGGLTALGIASVGSPKLDIAVVNADETPNEKRPPKQLTKDTTASFTFPEHRAAIAEAAIPALSDALNNRRRRYDYARHAISHVLRSDSAALRGGMANPHMLDLVERATKHYPDVHIKIGYVLGSKLFKPFSSENPMGDQVTKVIYTGDGTQRHATGDNVVVSALMTKQAFRRAA